jgi:hypothetical protein
MKLATRATTVVVAGGAVAAAAVALAIGPDQPNLTNVASANTKVVGMSAPNLLSSGVADVLVAQGSIKLENGSDAVPYYGYDGPAPAQPPFLPASGSVVEP